MSSEQKAREIHAFLAAAKDAPGRTAYQVGTEESPEIVLGDETLAEFEAGEVGLREAERYAALLSGCEAVAELVRSQDRQIKALVEECDRQRGNNSALRREVCDLRDEIRRMHEIGIDEFTDFEAMRERHDRMREEVDAFIAGNLDK